MSRGVFFSLFWCVVVLLGVVTLSDEFARIQSIEVEVSRLERSARLLLMEGNFLRRTLGEEVLWSQEAYEEALGLREVTREAAVLVSFGGDRRWETERLLGELSSCRDDYEGLTTVVFKSLREEREALDKSIKEAEARKRDIRQKHDVAFAKERRLLEDRKLLVDAAGWLNATALVAALQTSWPPYWRALKRAFKENRRFIRRSLFLLLLRTRERARQKPEGKKGKGKIKTIPGVVRFAQADKRTTRGKNKESKRQKKSPAAPIFLSDAAVRAAHLAFRAQKLLRNATETVRRSPRTPSLLKTRPLTTLALLLLLPFELRALTSLTSLLHSLIGWAIFLVVALPSLARRLGKCLLTLLWAIAIRHRLQSHRQGHTKAQDCSFHEERKEEDTPFDDYADDQEEGKEEYLGKRGTMRRVTKEEDTPQSDNLSSTTTTMTTAPLAATARRTEQNKRRGGRHMSASPSYYILEEDHTPVKCNPIRLPYKNDYTPVKCTPLRLPHS